LKIQNNIWWKVGGENTTVQTISPDVTGEKGYSQDFVRAYLSNADNHNWIEDPQLQGVGRDPNGLLDPRPAYTSPAFSKPVYPVPDDDNFFVKANYIGAFGPGDLWLDNWTLLSKSGTLKQLRANNVVIDDGWINAGDKKRMTSDNVYHLRGLVFVEEGAELHIEAGTVIKGMPGQQNDASALVICKGGKIFAEGTPTQPIIFTAEADDPYDMQDLPLTETGQWGGVIILGKAETNIPGGEGQIEGISELEPRGKFGMPPGEANNHDNSGVMRYVSIRHGGTDIGDGNEINGLTLGAVGDGTTIEFVEVWYNNDDGFEFFGGTVNTRYLVSAFNKDDSFDYDVGFNGKGQFWFSIQAPNRGNNGGEHDGGDKPKDAQPYARPMIYNATYIGSGLTSGNTKSRGIHLRDNAGGKYFNSIFYDIPGAGLEIEDLASGEDSRHRLEVGDLKIQNNIWWKVGGENTTVQTISPDVTGEKGYSQDFVRAYLSNSHNKNSIEDPKFIGVSRNNDGGLLPIGQSGSPIYTKERAPIYNFTAGKQNQFFATADYIGAFDKINWLSDWTLLSSSGVSSGQKGGIPRIKIAQGIDEPTSVIEKISYKGLGSLNCYPNPVLNTAEIQFTVDEMSFVKIEVYDIFGQKVKSLVNEKLIAGEYSVEIETKDLPAGMYFIRMEMPNNLLVEKMIKE